MKMRLIVLLLFAFVAAAGTVFFARSWLDAQRAAMTQAPPPPPPAHNEVLVAKDNLPAGTLLKTEDLRWQAWPDATLASSYILKDKRKPDDFAGAVVRIGLTSGQPITDTVVVKPGESGFLAAVLKPDMRAVSVSIDATTGISGFIFPGDRVDVILTQIVRQPGDDDKVTRHASETVLSDVRVIAVDQTVNDQENKPAVAKNVTLEVTPKQAEIIAVTGELGKLSLSLRSMVRNESNNPQEQEDGKPTLVSERHTYTWDSQASVLLGTPTGGAPINVLHGNKAETTDLRSTK